MAERVELYKGITFRVEGRNLTPDTEYFATLRDAECDTYISSGKVSTDASGRALFVFPYERTLELRDEAVLTLFIFDADRNAMEVTLKKFFKVIPTSLKNDKDVTINQINNIE